MTNSSYTNSLLHYLTFHTTILEKVLTITDELLVLSSQEDYNFDDFYFLELVNKRDRLIVILSNLEQGLKKGLNSKQLYSLDSDYKNIILIWQEESRLFIEKAKHIDSIIFEKLKEAKLKTKKDISSLFSIKSKIKNYNIKNIKNF